MPSKSDEMKIFVLLPRIPYPLEKGDKLRAFNQIKQLAKSNEIVLCALNENPKVNEQDAFHALQPYCQSINFIRINKAQILVGLERAFFKGLPLQSGYFYNHKAVKKINALIAKHKPDILYDEDVNIIIAENKAKMVEAIRSINESPQTAIEIGKAARKLVEETYDNRKIIARLLMFYEQIKPGSRISFL